MEKRVTEGRGKYQNQRINAWIQSERDGLDMKRKHPKMISVTGKTWVAPCLLPGIYFCAKAGLLGDKSFIDAKCYRTLFTLGVSILSMTTTRDSTNRQIKTKRTHRQSW
ncbi:hypothetical protein CW304_29230 [Bacillus sp. UFRGS-B20]|nr:hypothetical protein CW304_29230 [Bacillus sp. UFRGS-B20]